MIQSQYKNKKSGTYEVLVIALWVLSTIAFYVAKREDSGLPLWVRALLAFLGATGGFSGFILLYKFRQDPIVNLYITYRRGFMWYAAILILSTVLLVLLLFGLRQFNFPILIVCLISLTFIYFLIRSRR